MVIYFDLITAKLANLCGVCYRGTARYLCAVQCFMHSLLVAYPFSISHQSLVDIFAQKFCPSSIQTCYLAIEEPLFMLFGMIYTKTNIEKSVGIYASLENAWETIMTDDSQETHEWWFVITSILVSTTTLARMKFEGPAQLFLQSESLKLGGKLFGFAQQAGSSGLIFIRIWLAFLSINPAIAKKGLNLCWNVAKKLADSFFDIEKTNCILAEDLHFRSYMPLAGYYTFKIITQDEKDSLFKANETCKNYRKWCIVKLINRLAQDYPQDTAQIESMDRSSLNNKMTIVQDVERPPNVTSGSDAPIVLDFKDIYKQPHLMPAVLYDYNESFEIEPSQEKHKLPLNFQVFKRYVGHKRK